jgi:hypothetical protein
MLLLGLKRRPVPLAPAAIVLVEPEAAFVLPARARDNRRSASLANREGGNLARWAVAARRNASKSCRRRGRPFWRTGPH